jgi:Na+/proline symporter
MSPTLILTCIVLYSLLLFGVVWLTSRKADNESYFVGNRSSRWYVVAYGMIGASLSGVTFISVPGWVYTSQLSYMQVIFGYFVGYWVIAFVLLPLYYRLNLTSIYTYLGHRFGDYSHKTGSFFFMLSRIIGAAGRLYIVVNVLQAFVFDAIGIPFLVTTAVFIALILLYTYQGGVKTIVWTDTLQTTFMLLSVLITIILVCHALGFSFGDMVKNCFSGKYSQMIFTDWKTRQFFPKQFFGGMFIAIAMTGLDQEMMQKNISCRTVGESKKNMILFSFVMLLVTVMFLVLGSLLYAYFEQGGVAVRSDANGIITDEVFPTIALRYLGIVPAIFFIIGLISAAYPSADGALTALTSCFCIDFLGIKKENNPLTEEQKKRTRYVVHLSFAALLLLVIIGFRLFNADTALVNRILTLAGYTYGPLLGLFAFGICTRTSINDKGVPYVCLVSPVICWLLDTYSKTLFNGYVFGFELLVVNGLITFMGLLALRKRNPPGPGNAS